MGWRAASQATDKTEISGATVTAIVTAGFSFDDVLNVNSKDELTEPTPGRGTSIAVRTVISSLVASHFARLDQQARR